MKLFVPLVLAAVALADPECGCKKNKALKPAAHLAEKIINAPQGIKFGEWKKCAASGDAAAPDNKEEGYKVSEPFMRAHVGE